MWPRRVRAARLVVDSPLSKIAVISDIIMRGNQTRGEFMKCSNCGIEMGDGAQFCTSCGNKLVTPTSVGTDKGKAIKAATILGSIAIIAIAIVLIAFFFSNKSEPQPEQQVPATETSEETELIAVPDLLGMDVAVAMQIANGMSLNLTVSGNGIITKQTPLADSKIQKDGMVAVTASSPDPKKKGIRLVKPKTVVWEEP